MKYYIIIRGVKGTFGKYEIDPGKPIVSELIRVIKDRDSIIQIGDEITFISRGRENKHCPQCGADLKI